MTLRLQFLDGQLLKSTDIGSKMENYISVTVLNDPRSQGRELRTKIVQGSAKTKTEENRIQFNDVLEVPISSPDARLLIKIMDEDMTSDDTCSQGFFNVGPCGALSNQQNLYRLITYEPPKKDKAPVAGSGGDLRFVAQYFAWLFENILHLNSVFLNVMKNCKNPEKQTQQAKNKLSWHFHLDSF